MWQVIGASVVGRRARYGLPCQDAHAYTVLNESMVVVAAADGLGSAARADEGANLAVQTAVQLIAGRLACPVENPVVDLNNLIEGAFSGVRKELASLAEREQVPAGVFATTLLVAILTPEQFALEQIGDGAMVAWLEDGTLATLSKPFFGEYINETMPVTASEAMQTLHTVVQAGSVKGLAVFTDGIQALCLNLITGQPFEPFFQPLFNLITQPGIDQAQVEDDLASFLASERVAKLNDDDKTLVLIGRIH